MSISIISDMEQARATILRRIPFDEVQVSQEMLGRIEELLGAHLTPIEAVQMILRDVRRHGDEAVKRYTRQLDGVVTEQLRVSSAELEEGWQATPPALREALQLASDRIRAFHESQPVRPWAMRGENALGQIIRPLGRVGVYAPGGSVAYPSSVLMAAVPARVAGVSEVLLATPPGRDGRVPPAVLAAARIARVDAVYKMGGAQAIAALAYGTESVPRVDKVVGPGNLFVTLAKGQVYGDVGIDGLFGPTETMIIADDSAHPQWIAADLIAQAEHDVLASAILLTPSTGLALRVQVEVTKQLADLPRQDIAVQSLGVRGGIVLTESIEQAVELANEYGPEHLCLALANPASWVKRIENAGGIFLGEMSSEALGDYVIGPSHIMPTGGTARFTSAVNVWDFVKIINVFDVSDGEVRQISGAASEIAEAEGLHGHACAIRWRVAGKPSRGVSDEDTERD